MSADGRPRPSLIDLGVRRLDPGAQVRSARLLTAFFAGIWLLYLIQPVQGLFGEHRGGLYIAAGTAVVAAFCAVYIALTVGRQRSAQAIGERPSVPYLLPGLAALFVLAGMGSLLCGSNGVTSLWLFVSIACGLVIPVGRNAVRAVVWAGACYTAFSPIEHVGMTDYLVTLLPTVVVGLAMIGLRRQIELTRELAQAREAVVRLAASEERLRFARDLHDLTGQSLSMITLKSELAARHLGRLPAGADRDKALAEIRQIGEVSRQTLHDTREAVSGYRRPTLAVEITTARTALASAGIVPHGDPALTLLSGTFDPDAEAALAWCLREAVTNVIRHSGAKNCHVSLIRHDDTMSLEVRDDGAGMPPDSSGSPGTGLHGMSERLTAVGGHLKLSPNTDGFCLVATVPARDAATVDGAAVDGPAVDGPAVDGATVAM